MFKQVPLPLNSSLLDTDWRGQRLVNTLDVFSADQVTSRFRILTCDINAMYCAH